MAFHKATKAQSKLRLALCGLAGSGKTFSALAVADAIGAEMRRLGHGSGKTALIDTEHESASLYADRFDFDTCPLDNHSPRAYVDTIREAERLSYDIVIIDSLSHAWSGKNGALEQKDNAAARGGNSWTAWRDITPMHNALVDAMLASKCHVIATMRQKMEYIQTTTNGKTAIEKVGLAAIQREGMEYEFTLVGDLGLDHVLRISKTRLDGVVSMGEAFERPGELFAKKIYGWLMSGVAPAPRPAVQQPEPMAEALDEIAANALTSLGKAETLAELDALVPALKMLSGDALAAGRRIYGERKAYIMKKIADAAAPNPTSGASSQDTTKPPASSGISSDALTRLIDTGKAVLDAMPDAPTTSEAPTPEAA